MFDWSRVVALALLVTGVIAAFALLGVAGGLLALAALAALNEVARRRGYGRTARRPR